jgi:hypothetical protein
VHDGRLFAVAFDPERLESLNGSTELHGHVETHDGGDALECG